MQNLANINNLSMYSKYFFIRVLQLFVCSFLVVVVAVVGNGPVYGAPNLEKKPIIKSSKQSYGRVSSYSDLLKTTLRAQQNAQKNPEHYSEIDCPITVGVASYYANRFVGRTTTSGVPYYHSGYTAASNDLPLMSVAKVTNISNGNAVHVLITDRGAPHMKTIDLSKRSAEHLGFIREGITAVIIEYNPELTEEVMNNPNYHLVYNMDEPFIG